MSTLTKHKIIRPFAIQEKLEEKGMTLFTPNEFWRLFSLSPEKTKYFLETYTKQGLFIRLKKGIYALKRKYPNEEVIANTLYKPSYISLEYALAVYGIIPESPYTITSVTTKATASFVALGREFSYTKIKKMAFTGYVPKKAGDRTYFIADPEKAVADYMYFVALGKRSPNDRMTIGRLNRKKIERYAKLYNRPKLNALIKTLSK